MFKSFPGASRCRWALRREQKSFTESYSMNIPWFLLLFQIIAHNLLLANLLKEWMSALTEVLQGSHSLFFINLLKLFVMLLRLKTHPCRWKVLSSKIKVDSLLNGHKRASPLSLVSRLRPTSPSVIRSLACASWRKTATGDWQPTTGFMAVVSGGRQVSRMDDFRGILHCPLVLWHILYFLSPAHTGSFWLLYVPAALAAQQQTRKEATVHLNIM